MVYEHRASPLISKSRFIARIAAHALASFVLLAGSLAIGMAGYMHYESYEWRDAFLTSAMLLGGMGPVGELNSPEGKLFAGMYALYAGLVFIISAGLVLAPAMHRILHRFHLDDESG